MSKKLHNDRPQWRRLVDYIFGYDFFISYKWADGRKYAERLAQELQSQGYEVFLDSERFGTGDDWQEIGSWTLKRTGQLILVATKLALEPAKSETPVERELRVFSETRRRVIPITFAPRKPDGSFDYPASTIELARGNSTALRYIPAEMVVLKEDSDLRDTGPSPETIKEIVKTFNLVRQDKKRVAIFGVISLILLVLAIASVLLGVRAEASRRTVSNQLSERLHLAAGSTVDPLEAFLLAAKAAQASTPNNDKLSTYLDRMMQLSTRLPNRVIHLPMKEGVESFEFNNQGDRVALVTENSKAFVFRLPEGKELHVPESVNRLGIAMGPDFDEDGVTLRTWLRWTHPDEPDPEVRRTFVLKADWNVETGEVFTPVDNGSIDPQKLEWRVFSERRVSGEPEPFETNTPPFMRQPAGAARASSNAHKASVESSPRLKKGVPPAGEAKAAGKARMTVTPNGTVMIWQDEGGGLLVTNPVQNLQKESWRAASFVSNYFVTLNSENVLVVRSKEGNRIVWTNTVSAGGDNLQISPDEAMVAVGRTAYRLDDGNPVGTATASGKWDSEKVIAVADGGRLVSGWISFDGNKDDFGFEISDFATGKEGDSYSVDFEPTEFMGFLVNGRYFLVGSVGSFQLHEIQPKVAFTYYDTKRDSIASFYFANMGSLSPELAKSLVAQTIAMEKRSDTNKAMLVLRGGARLEIVAGSGGNRELRLAEDGAVVVNPRSDEKDELLKAALSPDGRWLATLRKGSVQVWDARTGYPLIGRLQFDGDVLDIHFTQDGDRFLIATTRGEVITATIGFPWNGKPAWLEGLAEGLTGLTLTDNGGPKALSLRDAAEQRSRLLISLKNADPRDKAAAYLRARFDIP